MKRGTLLLFAVIGLIAVAFVVASVWAVLTHDEDQRQLLMKVGFGLILLFAAVPKSGCSRSERTRLLQLGWTLFVLLGLIFAASMIWPVLDGVRRSPWGYMFLAVAVGMVLSGHRLPKAVDHGADVPGDHSPE